MSLDFLGGAGSPPSKSYTCAILTGHFFVVVTVVALLNYFGSQGQCEGGTQETVLVLVDGEVTKKEKIKCPDGTYDEDNLMIWPFVSIVVLAFWLFFLNAVYRTRVAVRKKYNIPVGCCGGCEDLCYSCWCNCCTVSILEYPLGTYGSHSATHS